MKRLHPPDASVLSRRECPPLLSRRVVLTSLFVLSVLLSSPVSAQTENGDDISWTTVSPYLDIGIAQLRGGLFPGEVTLLRSSMSKLRPRVVRAAALGRRRGDTEWFAKKTGASLCVNGNFFDKEGKALGLVVSKGVEYHPVQRGGALLTGLFLVFRDRLSIVSRADKREEFGLEAFQAGPRLVTDGKPIGEPLDAIDQSRRSGICLTSKTDYIVFVASSTLRGPSLAELAEILVKPSVGCQEALNLDGGGSTQLFVPPSLPGATADFAGINVVGRDDVPTALCLFPTA